MQVSRCSETKSIPAVPTLSREQMLKEEGVYKKAGGTSDGRIIVLKWGSMTNALWYLPQHGTLEPTNLGIVDWQYEKTNEKVCFELRAE